MRETVKRHSLWYLAQGGLMILGGILALLFPIFAGAAVVVLLGWVLIISGVVQGISILGARAVPHFWLQLVSVALSVVVGVLFLSSPDGGLLTLTFLLIVFFMVEGIAKVIFALTIRPFPNWGWVLGSGALGIVIAVFLWSNIANVAPWLLGLLLGIQLIAEGAALGYLAWQVRRSGGPKPTARSTTPSPSPAPPPSGTSGSGTGASDNPGG
ncbi:MAG: HdeD family acid-resistance protein [Hyphomicrobiales bacterium]|nr:HdeD family acid-resistance protein [Hyphomicrobiales bacterium]